MLRDLKRLWLVTRPRDRLKYYLLTLMMIGSGALDFVGIGMVPLFVAGLADNARLMAYPYIGPFLRQFGLDDPSRMLFLGGGALIAVFLVRGVYQIAFFYVKSKIIHIHVAHFATELFRAYMESSYAFHLSRNTSIITRNIQTEAVRLASNILIPLVHVMFYSISALALSALVLSAEPLLGGAVIGFVGIVFMGYIRSIRRRVHKHGKNQSRTASKSVRTINESINGFKEIRLGAREDFFVNELSRALIVRAHAMRFHNFANQSLKPLLESLAVIGMIAVVFTMVIRGSAVQDTIPGLVLLAAVMARILPSVNQIARHFVTMQGAQIALKNLLDDFAELRKLADEQAARYTPTGATIAFDEAIRLEDVSFTYENASRPALDGVSLTIPKGTSVAFIGSTGAGKTTIVDLMLGLLEPGGGRITVDGHDIRDDIRAWQRHIGYIPQSIALFDATIRRNVALGIPETEIDDARVRAALETAQLADFVDTLEKGMETVIGERGVRLSGGQRQRIGIARALYHQPDVLVLDEATAAVDNVTERRLMEALDAARRNRTFVMIAHRLSTVRNCDCIYLLKEGRIAMAGTYDELLARSVEFRNMAGVPAVAE